MSDANALRCLNNYDLGGCKLPFEVLLAYPHVLTISKTLASTIAAPVQTHYAACDVTNQLNSDTDMGLFSYQAADGIQIETISEGGTMTPYDCCSRCMRTTGCAAAAFLAGNCDMLMTDPTVCLPSNVVGNYTTSDAMNSGQGCTLSSGACGIFAPVYAAGQ